MKLNLIIRYIGMVLLLNAAFLLLSALISLYNNWDTGFYPLLLSFIITAVVGSFPLIFVPPSTQMTTKESYVVVVGSWLLCCVVGMLPYLIWGGEFDLVNALFESTSGYTTTGSTILKDVQALPYGMLFWRSSTHWIGGVGVVMFALVVLPAMGNTKMMLSNIELSSLAKENYRYRTQKIPQIILVVYVGLTLAETLLLRIAGMNWFDAVNHAFSTIATGGFSTKNLSIAYFDNVWIEIIVSLFMIISGIHFGLIFATLVGKRNNIFRSEVARYYLLSLLVLGLIVAVDLWISGFYPTFLSSVRYGMFQVISLSTTTGFATANSSLWGDTAILILIFCTFQCACAGSTAGGIKCDRTLLALKAIRAKTKQQQHPSAIIPIKMNGIQQENDLVSFVSLFIVMYLLLVVLGTFAISVFGVDLITSFSIAFTSMANAGPGFGQINSMANYGDLPGAAKVIASLLMLLGRLEIFGFIQIFLIKTWR